MDDINQMDGKDIIIGLRGIPDSCSFCYQKKPVEELEPEEGGDWVCHDCLKRWGEM